MEFRRVLFRTKPVAPSRLHLSVKPGKGRASGGVNVIRHGMTINEGPFAAIWSRAYPLLTVTALFWAGNSIVGRAARDLVPPAALSFWRWTLDRKSTRLNSSH